MLKPTRTLGVRVRELDIASSEVAEELDELTDSLLEVFPEQPLLENLHIIAKLDSGEHGWLYFLVFVRYRRHLLSFHHVLNTPRSITRFTHFAVISYRSKKAP